jgi:hypothetical protein
VVVHRPPAGSQLARDDPVDEGRRHHAVRVGVEKLKRGAVVIAVAAESADRGFKSRHILRAFNGKCWYINGYLVHFMVNWYILRSFGTLCGHLVQCVVIWYSFPRFGML